jgi:hypothetical protein
MMANLYSFEVTIHATLYVVAEDEAAAVAEAKTWKGQGVELPTGFGSSIEVNGDQFSADMPEVSLSPAVTFGEVDLEPELVEEFGDPQCRTCGEAYRGGGDGWDGECPECADKTAAAEGDE